MDTPREQKENNAINDKSVKQENNSEKQAQKDQKKDENPNEIKEQIKGSDADYDQRTGQPEEQKP